MLADFPLLMISRNVPLIFCFVASWCALVKQSYIIVEVEQNVKKERHVNLHKEGSNNMNIKRRKIASLHMLSDVGQHLTCKSFNGLCSLVQLKSVHVLISSTHSHSPCDLHEVSLQSRLLDNVICEKGEDEEEEFSLST